MRSIGSYVAIQSLLLSICFLFACKESDSSDRTTDSKNKQEIAPVPKKSPIEQVTIKSAKGNAIFDVHFRPDGSLTITADHRLIEAKIKQENKRVYSTDGYEFIEAQTEKDGHFKLITIDGQLLWKVQVYKNKLRISDNEEYRLAYEIKRMENGTVKVYHQKQEIAASQQDGDTVRVISGSSIALSIPTGQNTMAYAVLGIPQIPVDERYVLMAELLTRGL